jgi:hypothetical protein
MQKCLNDEYKEDIKCLSNPACCTLVLITLLVACIFPFVGVYCYDSWSCPPYMGAVFLEIGLIADIFIVVFIISPCFVRLLLNCCYDELPKVPKVPSPPKSKPPKSAFTSFSETVAKGRSKSLEYTENPLTEKKRAASRSRSRSKSDSEV